MKEFTVAAKDGLLLSCAVFEAENASGTVQIIHGAKGHKERFYEFAGQLCAAGFRVVLSDLRGHGASVNAAYPLGFMEDPALMTDDLVRVSRFILSEYGRPLYIFAHSLGSVLARLLLQEHDDLPAKLVLAGMLPPGSGSALLLPAARLLAGVSGKYRRSPVLERVKDQNDLSWVNTDPKVLEAMRADPLSNYMYPGGSLAAFLGILADMGKKSRYQVRNPLLPILSVSGGLDPATGGEKGLKKSIAFLKDAGYQNIRRIVYPAMKHETINTIGKEQVWADIVSFLKE